MRRSVRSREDTCIQCRVGFQAPVETGQLGGKRALLFVKRLGREAIHGDSLARSLSIA